ncbi:MAG: glycerol-3-phosphate 1-O-acyltransferase [Sphingobacteriales bacterium]|nr:MAG: glycerol-3-phosphate 1-O-acyltransferase [Sphingobacteriales bacterium]
MSLFIIAIAFLIAYLLGAIPSAVWFGKGFYGIDVRQHGSGNSGATNTFRVLGKKPGTLVLLFDIMKGWAATMLAVLLLHYGFIESDQKVLFQLLLGMTAVLGHIYPVYLGFKGGKGVATLLGMMLAIHPLAALTSLGVFVVVLLLTRFVSLGSILGALSFPLLLLAGLYGHESWLLIGFGALLALLVLYTHRQNISRLLRGSENKVKLW